MFQSIDGADGAFGFQCRKRIHFRPEVDRIAELAFGDEAKPFMLSGKHERTTFLLQAFAIAFKQPGTDVFTFEGQTSGLDG